MVFAEKMLEFTDTRKKVNLELSEGGNMMINLDKVGEGTVQDNVCFMKRESDITTRKPVSKIHRILNH